MSSACIPFLVGVTSSVSEILLLFEFVQFSLSDHGGQQIESADIVQHLVVDEMSMYT